MSVPAECYSRNASSRSCAVNPILTFSLPNICFVVDCSFKMDPTAEYVVRFEIDVNTNVSNVSVESKKNVDWSTAEF